jgi:hypothetical protein
MSGAVVDIEDLRRRRETRRLAAAALAPLHPALRWSAEDGHAHRRTRAGGTACGAPGVLRLAPPQAALCPSCYRQDSL